MRTQITMRHLAWGVFGLVTQQAFSQASQANNNGGATSFLGWNAGANQILEVKNEANQRIEWYTANTMRMSLNGTTTSTIGSFSGLNTDGFHGLAPNGTLLSQPPYTPMSRLHLHQGVGTIQTFGYRPWMQNGITFTGNNDQAYIGHLYRGASLSECPLRRFYYLLNGLSTRT